MGVSNAEDLCPETPAATSVDATGCALAEASDDETSTSLLSSFFSGDSDPVTTTVGVGAILLALFTLLQTNAVAAVLPDAFRWVQVMRKNSKLTKEELNELTYLQSITQAYYGNPRELAEELEQLRGDLTARYTNNDIKKQTREKLFTLIDELLASTPDQLHRIAHNDAYFGLAGTLDAEDRTRLLNEKLAMTNQESATPAPPAHHGQPSLTAELSVMRQWNDENDRYTWAEMSDGSHRWWNGTDWPFEQGPAFPHRRLSSMHQFRYAVDQAHMAPNDGERTGNERLEKDDDDGSRERPMPSPTTEDEWLARRRRRG